MFFIVPFLWVCVRTCIHSFWLAFLVVVDWCLVGTTIFVSLPINLVELLTTSRPRSSAACYVTSKQRLHLSEKRSSNAVSIECANNIAVSIELKCMNKSVCVVVVTKCSGVGVVRFHGAVPLTSCLLVQLFVKHVHFFFCTDIITQSVLPQTRSTPKHACDLDL